MDCKMITEFYDRTATFKEAFTSQGHFTSLLVRGWLVGDQVEKLPLAAVTVVFSAGP